MVIHRHRSFFMDERIFSVSEISQEIRRVVEEYIPSVWIEGEVSNFMQSRAGHIYFSLKDSLALIDCVVWKSYTSSIRFQITTGMQLIVRGDVTTYGAQSKYQINVREIRTAGFGNLYLAFEALKEKMNNAGYFDESRKREIPRFPTRVGIVTSPTGAAIQDMLQISRRRNPAVEIIIYPALVQGDSAADSIVAGIRTFNMMNNVDFIIIGRGGGSIEDLWAFNEEKLVVAVANSRLPVVSAVGHEVDYTLSDFAADLRAPTPSAAIELTIPELSEIQNRIDQFEQLASRAVLRKYQSVLQRIESAQKRLESNRPIGLIHQRIQRVDQMEMRMFLLIRQILQNRRSDFENFTQMLKVLNPKSVLNRGFSIVYHLPEKKIVKSVNNVAGGDAIQIEVSDGAFDARVGENNS